MQGDSPGPSGGGLDVAILDAASACCLTLDGKEYQVGYKGVEAPLLSAGRSADFTTALLDIGLISLHLGAPGILDTIDLPRSKAIVAILMDYAADISPRMTEAPNVIDGAAVIEKAREMRSRVINPDTDPELIHTIGVISQLTVDGVISMKLDDQHPRDQAREQ